MPIDDERGKARVLLAVLAVFLAGSFCWPNLCLAQDLERGRALFERLECAMCHGAVAQGDFGPRLAGTTLTFEEVRRQVRDPAGLMPTFPVSRLSDEALADIYAWIQSVSAEEAPYPTWFGTDLLNLPTPDAPEPRTLEVHFSHRFSSSIADAGREGLWGLDSFAFPAFYFAYGLTDRISAYGGRSAHLATWEYGAKVELLRESRLPVPLSVSAVVGGTFIDTDSISNNSRFTAEFPVGLRADDRFSLLAVPFFVTNPDELDNPESDDYSAALGLGGSFRLTAGLSIDAEWITNLGGFERRDAVDQWQVFFAIKVGGHLFQIGVTNSIFTTPDSMAPGTQETGIKSDVRLGFNLVRAFKF